MALLLFDRFTSETYSPMKKLAIAILSTALVVLIAWLALDQLSGQAMSTDLSQIGQGQPSVVLAFENYSPGSMNALDQLNQIRGQYEPEVQFLVADLGTPEGRAFASRFGLSPGSTVLLDGSGNLIRGWPFGTKGWIRDLEENLVNQR